MAFILAAEDDKIVRDALAMALEGAGYDVRVCEDGAGALSAYRERRPDLLLLDVMMPRKSGYDVCVEVRKQDAATPILFLTAKSSEEDVVLGLGLGADDFIAKPFKIRELLARISSALRRSAAPNEKGSAMAGEVFNIGDATIDTRRFIVSSEEGEQPLTMRELGLLRELAEHPGEVLSRNDIIDSVWGMNYSGGTRTLDQHIVQVRRKLGKKAGGLIETVRSVGYRLAVPTSLS